MGRQYSSEAEIAFDPVPPLLFGLLDAPEPAAPAAIDPELVPRDCVPKVGTLEGKLLGSFNLDSRLAGIGDWRAKSFSLSASRF